MTRRHGRIVARSLYLFLITLLVACGGGGGGGSEPDPDPDPNPNPNGVDIISLSNLGYDHNGLFSPNRILAEESLQLEIKALTAKEATIEANDLVSWHSSDEAVVKVNDRGLVTTIAPGKATVSARWVKGDISLTSSIEFTVRTASIDITPSVKPTFAGDKVDLYVWAEWDDGASFLVFRDIVLSSSSPDIASFSNEQEPHQLLTHQAGHIVVTASYRNIRATLELDINEPFVLNANVTAHNQVELDWAALAGASSYTLTWSYINYFGILQSVRVENLQTTHYTHSDMDTYDRYAYHVTAIHAVGEFDTNTVNINLPKNNGALLEGDMIGEDTGVAPAQPLRKMLNLEIGTPPDFIELGDVYITRDSISDSLDFANIVVPITNTSKFNYCSISSSNPVLRDQAGNDIDTLITTNFILHSGLRDAGTYVPCLAPGDTGYFISITVLQAKKGIPDYLNVATLYLENVDILYKARNSSIKSAVIPQGYRVIPATPENPQQVLEVDIKNVGPDNVILYSPGSKTKDIIKPYFILLDENREPVSVGLLDPPAGWDGVLASGASITMTNNKQRDNFGSAIYVDANFYKQP